MLDPVRALDWSCVLRASLSWSWCMLHTAGIQAWPGLGPWTGSACQIQHAGPVWHGNHVQCVPQTSATCHVPHTWLEQACATHSA